MFSGPVWQRESVFLADDAGEDAGLGAAQGGGVDAGVFEGFPGGFEQEALLGVGGEGFAGADAEEVGVELVGVVEEAAVQGVGLAGCVGVGVVEGGRGPSRGWWAWSVMASWPLVSSCHSCSGVSMSPGKRQAMAMMAIGFVAVGGGGGGCGGGCGRGGGELRVEVVGEGGGVG